MIPARPMIRRWMRVDEPGLEVLVVEPEGDGLRASGTVVHAGEDPFGLAYVWHLDEAWRTRSLALRLSSPTPREMTIRRLPRGWAIDGREAPSLAGCAEIDLSATPFCNTLAMCRLAGPGELDTLYVDIPSLRVSPSRQRYETCGSRLWRYVDRGVAAGFEAMLRTDEEGFVVDYEGLFRAIGAERGPAA